MKKYLLGFLMIIAIAIPLYALAGGLNGPLVPCGTSTTKPCTLCDLFIMVQNVIDFIFAAIFILAPIYVLWGGFEILTSAGESGKVSNGKKKIAAAVVGIIIALVAWTGLNMGFNALVSVGEGFPWPWNEVKCEMEPTAEGDLVMCHLQYKDRPDAMIATLDTEADCKKDCSERCDLIIPRANCEAWCCLNVNKSGQDNVCIPTTSQWCQRPAPSGSSLWKLSGINSKQKGDASSALTSFINCMYGKISGLTITSISDDKLCSGSCDSTTGAGCSHTKNSCHYGGGNCTGSSYAVDFSIDTQCSNIKAAALSCNSSAWVNFEGSHTHISLNNSSCNCAEKGTGNPCP